MATPPQGRSRREQRAAHTESIKTKQIVNRLEKQALGEIEMSSQSIQAANILLKKTLPDLKVSEITAEVQLIEPIQWVGDEPEAD